MSRNRITKSGESAAILLPQEVLDQLGVDVGDEVDISIIERTLILRPLNAEDRAREIEDITQTVLERRRSAYIEMTEIGGKQK